MRDVEKFVPPVIDFAGRFIGEYAAQVKFEMDSGEEITPAKDFLNSWREDQMKHYGQAEVFKPYLGNLTGISFSEISARMALVKNTPHPFVIGEVRKRIKMEADWERLMENQDKSENSKIV